MIKKSPSEARDLLIKFFPGYHEPTDSELAASAKILWKMLVCELDLPGKKYWYEKGIVKAVIHGVDRATLNECSGNELLAPPDEVKGYLEDFSEMKARIVISEKGNEIVYKVEWGDEVKRILSAISAWRQSTEIFIPLRYDEGKGVGGSDPWEKLDTAEGLAEIYVPSHRVIDDLLDLAGLDNERNRVLTVLKKFCENALDVDWFDEETKKKIIMRLKDMAFVRENRSIQRNHEGKDNDDKERNNAFEIIEMLNARNEEIVNAANEFLFNEFEYPPTIQNLKGPDIHRVAKWLAKDPKSKSKIIDIINRLLIDADRFTLIGLLKSILKDIIV